MTTLTTAQAQSKLENQKLAYTRKLIKKAQSMRWGTTDTVWAFRDAADYADKWARVFENKKKKNSMITLSNRANYLAKIDIEWKAWECKEANRILTERENASKLYRQMTA
jgi:hypothetical protein